MKSIALLGAALLVSGCVYDPMTGAYGVPAAPVYGAPVVAYAPPVVVGGVVVGGGGYHGGCCWNHGVFVGPHGGVVAAGPHGAVVVPHGAVVAPPRGHVVVANRNNNEWHH